MTLCAALPVYRRVAEESPHGQGSIAMLERLLPHWKGKVLVLVLLGFAATDFMTTITLSAADATAHVIENPLAPHRFKGRNVAITLVLLALLTALFLRGFHKVVGLAVFLVFTYLALNLAVIASSLARIAAQPYLPGDWWAGLTASHGSPVAMVAVALLVFPKLALGLSGFETGVAVMPQIRNRPGDTETPPAGRIRGAKRLLTTAALTMSAFPIASSVAVTWLVPEDELQPGGAANGRALAYLAHEQLGEVFGTVFDASTIGILWFAGASAMAGMLNLIPRYLPRFGMAPEWARANRPLVLVLASIAVVVTVLFEASVANSFERPDGLRIAGFFILAIVLVSFASRFRRSTELRATTVRLDPAAVALLRGAEEDGLVRLIAHEPLRLSAERYRHKLEHARLASHLPHRSPTPFIEIQIGDFSDFAQDVVVRGMERHGYGVLEATAPAVPTAIAAICLHIRDELGIMPHVYFRWTEGSPLRNLLQFLFLGQGEIAPVTREVLREAEPNPRRRPWVHVG